jgi:hypothetical protein
VLKNQGQLRVANQRNISLTCPLGVKFFMKDQCFLKVVKTNWQGHSEEITVLQGLCRLDFSPDAVAQLLCRGRQGARPFAATENLVGRIQVGVVPC